MDKRVVGVDCNDVDDADDDDAETVSLETELSFTGGKADSVAADALLPVHTCALTSRSSPSSSSIT